MTTRRAGVLAALLALAAAPGARVAAQVTSDAARPLVLRRPASAVALALGEAGAVLADADVLFSNPAMLTQARGIAASAQRDGTGATGGALASVQAHGSTFIGLGARTLAWRGGPPTDDRLPGVAEASQRGTGLALTAGAARAVGPLRLGVGATWAREASGDAHQDVTLVDGAATLPFGPGNALSAAVIVQHVGRALPAEGAGDAAPWRTVLAVGGRSVPLATFWDLTATTQLAIDGDGTVRSAGGVELAWVPLEGLAIAFRAGRREPRAFERPVTGGVGLSLDRWSLDWAVDPQRDGQTAHRVGVRVR